MITKDKLLEIIGDIHAIESCLMAVKKDIEEAAEAAGALPAKSWPQAGDNYCLLLSHGLIFGNTWSNDQMEQDQLSQGNVFRTRKEAERTRDLRALHTEMQKFADENNDNSTGRYVLVYDINEDYIFTSYYLDSRSPFEVYFSRNCKDEALKLFGPRIKALYK